MNQLLRAACAGLLLSLLLAAAATAADVTVRVEGGAATLVPETRVTPASSVVVDKSDAACDGRSAGGALELATGGDWSGPSFVLDGTPSQTVDAIRGEAYPFSQNAAYWAFYVNNELAPVGLCDYIPAQGDEILFSVACIQGVANCFSGDPLAARAPATVAPGTPFTVTVEQYSGAQRTPAAGATVSGGGQTATAGADGLAAVTLTQRGPVQLSVTKAGRVRDAVDVCVTDGSDGACGYQIPAPGQPGAPGTPGGAGPAGAGPVDAARPSASIRRLKTRYRRGKGPRTLRAAIADADSGVADVKLALTRTRDKKCSGFGDRRGKFRRIKCGRRLLFSVGSKTAVSYLLPRKLGRGKYRFDVIAIDRAGNRTETRKRFRVR